jgi:chromate transporter
MPAPALDRDDLRAWSTVAANSFGGPAGQIAAMHDEIVGRRHWVGEPSFLHALNYCMLLPGPEAQQLATYLGWLMHRTWGGLVSGGLFILPSVFIIGALAWIYVAWGTLPAVAGVFYGIKPAVVAIVVAATVRIGARTLKNEWLWAIAVAAFLALYALGVPFPAIVLAAAAIGYAGGRIAPEKFAVGAGHAAGTEKDSPALIDDHTPTPPHAMFRWRRFLAVIGAGLALWAASLGALALALGWSATLTQIGWFFTKAALVTFGGAYAVLPYVYQAAVEHYGWLTAAQMIDGLALGETTPGPLIMVVAFVGFVCGWTRELFGAGALPLAGAAGLLVATFFTFLPSFIFIFAGAPFVETTHGNLRFTAPLAGITAAVVGVMVSLAVFFASHVFVAGGAPDWLAVLLAAAALGALMRLRAGLIPVIAACGAAGLCVRLLFA